jgi:transcriptional regulator with XRE-family HTH domain
VTPGNKELSVSTKTIYADGYRALIRRLRERRVELGLTQEQLAARVGRGRTWLQKVEAAERKLDVRLAVLVIRALGLKLEELADLVAEKSP